jgi:asparagine synthase (glutamine-hydrolysing)
MCGIAGYIGEKIITPQSIKLLKKAMHNRGPDNFSYSSIEIKKNLNLYLFHSRLSIVDLNKASNQPFKFKEYTLVYNGEIYNYVELRKKLINLGYKFKTSSDTEVLIKMFDCYKHKMFKFLQGMWSFAIWDKKKKELTLSRDRFGEKPLYYVKKNNELFFGSEINYINILKKEKTEINQEFFKKSFYYGYKALFLDSNLTPLKDFKFLEPSSNLIIDHKLKILKNRYWVSKYKLNKKISYNQAKKKLRKIIISSVNNTLRSDVDCVFGLSGGVDSSILVNIATKILRRKIRCYTIYDNNPLYNESKNIEANIKNNPLINHTYIYPKRLNLNFFKKMINVNFKPFYTITACVQNYFYKKISDDGYKVCINGTGADEIFTGYYRHYLYYFAMSKNLHRNKNFIMWKKNVKNILINPQLKETKNLNKVNIFSSDYEQDILNCLNFKNNNEIDNIVNFNKKNILRSGLNFDVTHAALPILLYHDDSNAMNFSVENRSPYLNHKLFELINRIDSKYLIKDGFLKYILRDTFKDLLPKSVAFDYSKKGYNYSFTNFFNSKKIISILFHKNSIIKDYVNKKKLNKLINVKNLPGLNKFIFSLLSLYFFNKLNNQKK